MKELILSFLLIINISCSSNRAIDGEKIIFSENTKPKLWMINGISTDFVGGARHINILINYTPVSEKNYVSFYTSFWSEKDKKFSYGYHSEEIPLQLNRSSFPVKIETAENDTMYNFSRWKFGRNIMLYQTVLYNDAIEDYFNFKMKALFEKKIPFTISNGSKMGNILPFNAQIKLSGDYGDQFPAYISLHLIHDPKEIIDKSKNNFIGFLDIHLRNGKYSSILFETDGSDHTTILDQSFWENGQNIYQNYSPKIGPDQDGKWYSSHSGKSYPLAYLITLPFYDNQILLKPAIDDQEIKANQNSFWMGAVNLFDKEGGVIVGVGNLYILKL
ncbi:MAG: lipocalin family protein [Saprospiraceae bacterium]